MSNNWNAQKTGNWSDPTVWNVPVSIVGVDQAGPSFIVNNGVPVVVGAIIVVAGSTGNNGSYTVTGVSVEDQTIITVQEAILSPIANGTLLNNTLPADGDTVNVSLEAGDLTVTVDIEVPSIVLLNLASGCIVQCISNIDLLGNVGSIGCQDSDNGNIQNLSTQASFSVDGFILGSNVTLSGLLTSGNNGSLLFDGVYNGSSDWTIQSTGSIGQNSQLLITNIGTIHIPNGGSFSGGTFSGSVLNVTDDDTGTPYNFNTGGSTTVLNGASITGTGTPILGGIALILQHASTMSFPNISGSALVYLGDNDSFFTVGSTTFRPLVSGGGGGSSGGCNSMRIGL